MLVAVGLAIPLAAEPVLSSMDPRGGQVGTAVRLSLTGDRLGPTASLNVGGAHGLAATSLVSQSSKGPTSADELAYLLEIAPDAAAGVYPLRVETEEGVSNALLFTIGPFPTIGETESRLDGDGRSNDFRDGAQAIEIPATLDGRLQGPEQDLFRFRASKGQPIVATVIARGVGSAIDPNLEVQNSAGLVIGRAADSPGLGLDARVAFAALEDGEYFAVVRDERYSDQKADFYRLTVGEYRYADTVYPLGWGRESPVEAEFSGGNLERPRKATVDLTPAPRGATVTWVPMGETPSTVPFVVGSGQELLEGQAAGTLSDRVLVNGRIGKPGERDTYRLAVRSGEQWAFELRSGELPGSELYGVMEIGHAGGTLAVAGKHAGDPNPYVITTTGQTASYPFVNLTVPPEVDELTVSVDDLLGRGGAGFAYRLLARRQGPDFLLSVVDPYVNIPQGGSAIVTVQAERRGYHGPIQLYVEEPPPELDISGGHIPPSSRLNNTLDRFVSGSLTLTASTSAGPSRTNLVIRGRAAEDGPALDRRATAPGIRVNVSGPNQAPVTAPWLGADLPLRITSATPARLEFLTDRQLRLVKGAGTLTAKWAFADRRPGTSISTKVDLPRNSGSLRLRKLDGWDGASGGEFAIFAHERTSLGTVDFNLRASVKRGDRELPVLSKPLEIEIVEGYGITPPEAMLELAAGDSGTWTGSIWREGRFRRTVTVTAIGLPSGLACEAAELVGDETDFELRCSASLTAPVGAHEVEIKAESVLSDEGTTPYPADPAKARVTILR